MFSSDYSIWQFLKDILFDPKVLTVIAAAVASIFPGFGSAKAVGSVGEALDGLLSEDPDKFGKGLLLQLLPATQGIYGLIIAFMIMLQLPDVSTVAQGFYFIGTALPIACCGYFSAVKQGRVSAAGIATIAKKPEASGKTALTAAMVELYALLALLISFLLVINNPF
jgi:V/A-type H+-transporting ATPase subunit K